MYVFSVVSVSLCVTSDVVIFVCLVALVCVTGDMAASCQRCVDRLPQIAFHQAPESALQVDVAATRNASSPVCSLASCTTKPKVSSLTSFSSTLLTLRHKLCITRRGSTLTSRASLQCGKRRLTHLHHRPRALGIHSYFSIWQMFSCWFNVCPTCVAKFATTRFMKGLAIFLLEVLFIFSGFGQWAV